MDRQDLRDHQVLVVVLDHMIRNGQSPGIIHLVGQPAANGGLLHPVPLHHPRDP